MYFVYMGPFGALLNVKQGLQSHIFKLSFISEVAQLFLTIDHNVQSTWPL